MKLQFNWRSDNIRSGYYDSDLNKVFIQFNNSDHFPYTGDKDVTKFCDEELLVYFRMLSLLSGECIVQFPLYSNYIMNEDCYIVKYDPNLEV